MLPIGASSLEIARRKQERELAQEGVYAIQDVVKERIEFWEEQEGERVGFFSSLEPTEEQISWSEKILVFSGMMVEDADLITGLLSENMAVFLFTIFRESTWTMQAVAVDPTDVAQKIGEMFGEVDLSDVMDILYIGLPESQPWIQLNTKEINSLCPYRFTWMQTLFIEAEDAEEVVDNVTIQIDREGVVSYFISSKASEQQESEIFSPRIKMPPPRSSLRNKGRGAPPSRNALSALQRPPPKMTLRLSGLSRPRKGSEEISRFAQALITPRRTQPRLRASRNSTVATPRTVRKLAEVPVETVQKLGLGECVELDLKGVVTDVMEGIVLYVMVKLEGVTKQYGVHCPLFIYSILEKSPPALQGSKSFFERFGVSTPREVEERRVYGVKKFLGYLNKIPQKKGCEYEMTIVLATSVRDQGIDKRVAEQVKEAFGITPQINERFLKKGESVEVFMSEKDFKVGSKLGARDFRVVDPQTFFLGYKNRPKVYSIAPYQSDKPFTSCNRVNSILLMSLKKNGQGGMESSTFVVSSFSDIQGFREVLGEDGKSGVLAPTRLQIWLNTLPQGATLYLVGFDAAHKEKAYKSVSRARGEERIGFSIQPDQKQERQFDRIREMVASCQNGLTCLSYFVGGDKNFSVHLGPDGPFLSIHPGMQVFSPLDFNFVCPQARVVSTNPLIDETSLTFFNLQRKIGVFVVSSEDIRGCVIEEVKDEQKIKGMLIELKDVQIYLVGSATSDFRKVVRDWFSESKIGMELVDVSDTPPSISANFHSERKMLSFCFHNNYLIPFEKIHLSVLISNASGSKSVNRGNPIEKGFNKIVCPNMESEWVVLIRQEEESSEVKIGAIRRPFEEMPKESLDGFNKELKTQVVVLKIPLPTDLKTRKGVESSITENLKAHFHDLEIHQIHQVSRAIQKDRKYVTAYFSLEKGVQMATHEDELEFPWM